MTPEISVKWCANVGCEEAPMPRSRYCSDLCRQSAVQQRHDEEHIRRIFDQAEAFAGKTEGCRNCPGGFTYTDQQGSHWCMCGRDASNVTLALSTAAA